MFGTEMKRWQYFEQMDDRVKMIEYERYSRTSFKGKIAVCWQAEKAVTLNS